MWLSSEIDGPVFNFELIEYTKDKTCLMDEQSDNFQWVQGFGISARRRCRLAVPGGRECQGI